MLRPSRASFPGNDRFDVLAELGSGGMGIVYAVYDRQRRERLALKTLQDDDPGAILRLKNEFRALQDLQHPNLVTLGELFHENDQWFFTMDLVEGIDLISYVRSASVAVGNSERPSRQIRSAFDEARLRTCLAQLAEALSAIHATGRVHRDIKPGNVLVEPTGRLIVLDFGLVTHPEPGQKSVEHFFPLGTIDYMAPEQASSREVSPATDWYSVGVVVFEALTGQLPFSGGALKVLTDKQLTPPRRPSELVPGVPPDLDDLCLSLLDRDPTCPRGSRWDVNELDREARGVVELVAVAASPLTQRVIAAAAGIEEAEMFRLAGRLRTERLARTSGPTMDHTIETVFFRAGDFRAGTDEGDAGAGLGCGSVGGLTGGRTGVMM